MNCPICKKPMMYYDEGSYDCLTTSIDHDVGYRHASLWWIRDYNLRLEIGKYRTDYPTILSMVANEFESPTDINYSNIPFENAYTYLVKYHGLMVFT